MQRLGVVFELALVTAIEDLAADGANDEMLNRAARIGVSADFHDLGIGVTCGHQEPWAPVPPPRNVKRAFHLRFLFRNQEWNSASRRMLLLIVMQHLVEVFPINPLAANRAIEISVGAGLGVARHDSVDVALNVEGRHRNTSKD